MALLGQGSFAVKKLIDGKTLTFNLSSNCYTQIMSKDPTTFVPDFAAATKPLKVKPYLYASGGGTDNLISAPPRWFINDDPLQGTDGTANKTKWGATVETSADYALVVAKNLTSVPAIIIRAEYDYVDALTAGSITVRNEITVSRTENAGTTILALIDCPQDTFVTPGAGLPSPDITLTGRMIRGGDEDTSKVAYKWYVRSYVDGLYKLITATSAPAGAGLPAGALFAGAGTAKLIVKCAAVLNVGSFKLEVTDTDTTSSTYTKVASTFVTVFDMTDPYELKVDYRQGDSITATSSTQVEMQVYQHGGQVPNTWYDGKAIKFNRRTAAGVTDAAWTPTPAFTGWTATAGILSRSYSAGTGTPANRTITIVDSHLLTTQPVTVFDFTIDG